MKWGWGKKKGRERRKKGGASSVYIVHKLPSSPEVYTPTTLAPFCGANHLVQKFALLGGACLLSGAQRVRQRAKFGLLKVEEGMLGASPRNHCDLRGQQEMVLRISVQ